MLNKETKGGAIDAHSALLSDYTESLKLITSVVFLLLITVTEDTVQSSATSDSRVYHPRRSTRTW